LSADRTHRTIDGNLGDIVGREPTIEVDRRGTHERRVGAQHTLGEGFRPPLPEVPVLSEATVA
jgi:hypothetical protein